VVDQTPGHRSHLRQGHEDAEKGVVLGCSKTGNWIPAGHSREALGAASTLGLVADSDIVEGLGVSVQSWVGKSNGALSSSDTLLVDTGEDSSDDRSSHRGSALEGGRALCNNGSVVSKSRNIRETTADLVIDTAVGANRSVQVGVGLVCGVVVGEESLEGIGLVVGLAIDVAESTSRGERSDSGLWVSDFAASGERSSSNHGDVWAVRVIRREDVLVGAEALSVAVRDTGITTGKDDGDTLETKLHELVALTLLVVGGVVSLDKTVREGDDVGRLVGTALLRSVGVDGVDLWVVAGLAVGGVRAVRSIKGIQEVVEESGLVGEVPLRVVGLVESGSLGIDDGVGHLEIKIRLDTSGGLACGSGGTVNESRCGLGALGDGGSIFLEEGVQIIVGVDVAELEDAHGVRLVRERTIGDVVDGLDAAWGDGGSAVFGSIWVQGKLCCNIFGHWPGDSNAVCGVEASLLQLAHALGGHELDTGSHEVDVVRELMGDLVVVAANVLAVTARVLIEVVLGVEELLNIFGGSIELDPCLVGGQRDGLLGDS
jgi:hypothetical protein